jgi:hypothetical protein
MGGVGLLSAPLQDMQAGRRTALAGLTGTALALGPAQDAQVVRVVQTRSISTALGLYGVGRRGTDAW